MSVVVKVLQYLGNASALVYFSTPLFQVLKKKLYKNVDSIKNVSLALIIAILFNCLFWILNAGSSDDLKEWIPLLIANYGGLLINIILLFWYLYVLCLHDKKQFIGYGLFVVNLLVEVGYLIYRFIIADPKEDSFHVVGYMATVINIFMYSTPYFNYKTIINTKNSAAIPLYTIISGIVTCLIFFIQGFVSFKTTKDNFRNRQSNIETMVSNTISFILLGVLAALYGFHYTKKEPKAENHTEEIGINDEAINENINEGIA